MARKLTFEINNQQARIVGNHNHSLRLKQNFFLFLFEEYYPKFNEMRIVFVPCLIINTEYLQLG